MKKTLTLLMILAATMLLLPTVSAVDTAKHILPKLLKYQPNPAEPGNYVDVYLLVSNRREAVKDFSITLIPGYPFIPAEDQNTTIFLASIPALDETLLKWRVFVDLDARNEDYNMTWSYTWGGQGGFIKFNDEVSVQATDASLTVDHYEITPQPIRPGSNATLILNLQNRGRITAKDIDVTLDLSTTPFSTYGTGTYRRVNRILPNSEEEVSYNLVSDPKSETKVYSFPINLNFRDERNNKYNGSSRVSAIVNAPPQLMAVVEESTIKSKNVTGEVTFKIVNSGAVDIKFLQLQLVPSDQYDAPVASTTMYLGNLDTDDFETATFKMKSLVDAPTFMIKLDYSDPFNQQYNQTFEVPMRIVSAQELGGTQSYTWVYALIVAIILVCGIYWFNRKTGKK